MNLYRKIFRSFTAVASAASAILCGGCSVEDGSLDSVRSRTYPVEVVLENGVSTKVSVSDGVSLGWEDGDRLAVMALAGNVRSAKSELEVTVADAAGAVFKGTVKISERPETCIFAYPSEAGFTDDGHVIYSYGSQDGSHIPHLYGSCQYDETALSCEMRHVGGVMHLKTPSEVVSVTVRGNGGEMVSSFVCNPMTGEVVPSEDASSEFTVSLSGQDSYISMPPVNFAKGFSIICTAADGTRMYKSYSTDGGPDSGFDFTAGLSVEISFEDYVAFEAGVTVSASHTRDMEGRLDATSVSVAFAKSGAPDKVMSWGADVYGADGELVRTLAGHKSSQAVQMGVVDSWDYLPQGIYTLMPYYSMYGQRVDMEALEFSVPAPEFSVEISGYTSYDKYLAGDIDGANGCDNSTVYSISAMAGISDRILGNPRYQVALECSYDGAAVSSETGAVSLGDMAGQSWAAHSVSAECVFDGVAVSASRDFHVTGLPYSVSLNKGTTGWTTDNVSAESSYFKFSPSDAWALSPKFHIPGGIDAESVISAYAYHSNALKSYAPVVYVSASDVAIKGGGSFSLESSINTTRTYVDNRLNVQFTASLNALSIYVYGTKGSLDFPETDIQSCVVRYR